MTWTGPAPHTFYPPALSIEPGQFKAFEATLSKWSAANASLVKVVPAPGGVLLQITEVFDAPRRYFDLSTHQELEDYEPVYAQWLARHYTGLAETPIEEVVFQTEFNADYPSVNRLLPVYRITFETEDQLTAFVHTELGVIGSLTNDWKQTIQTPFQLLHTWSWLEGFENSRVVLLALLLLCLLGMLFSGLIMLFAIKSRRMPAKRRAHRLIAGLVWVPLFAFSVSGIFHLLVFSDSHRDYGVRLNQPFGLSSINATKGSTWIDSFEGVLFNSITLVQGRDGRLLYRLSQAVDKTVQGTDRQARFDGLPLEQQALYIDASTGSLSSVTDKDMAAFYASQHSGLPITAIGNMQRIEHFSPEYDFRNKRLPVWKVDYESGPIASVFIDPGTGALIDQLNWIHKLEGYSFSFLHKWSFAAHWVGRNVRDAAMLAIVFGVMVLAGLGVVLRAKHTRTP